MFSKDMHVSLLLDFYGDILPERRYEMTSLYYNDDLSLSEIADICGISVNTVKYHLGEAFRIMREELNGLSGCILLFMMTKVLDIVV